MGVKGTPRTDKAFHGDLSVGLFPEIHTFQDAEDFARQLEIELNKQSALYEAALKAAVAYYEEQKYLKSNPKITHPALAWKLCENRMKAEAEFAALYERQKEEIDGEVENVKSEKTVGKDNG